MLQAVLSLDPGEKNFKPGRQLHRDMHVKNVPNINDNCPIKQHAP